MMVRSMRSTQVARLLAYVTGMVNQQLLLQHEYLIAENSIPRAHLPARLRLTDSQGSTLAAIGKRFGRQALEQVSSLAQPETILAWHRRLFIWCIAGGKWHGKQGTGSSAGVCPSSVLKKLIKQVT